MKQRPSTIATRMQSTLPIPDIWQVYSNALICERKLSNLSHCIDPHTSGIHMEANSCCGNDNKNQTSFTARVVKIAASNKSYRRGRSPYQWTQFAIDFANILATTVKQ